MSSGKQQPGSCLIDKWYFRQSQHTPFLSQPGYVQLQFCRFCSFLHSIFDLFEELKVRTKKVHSSWFIETRNH